MVKNQWGSTLKNLHAKIENFQNLPIFPTIRVHFFTYQLKNLQLNVEYFYQQILNENTENKKYYCTKNSDHSNNELFHFFKNQL